MLLYAFHGCVSGSQKHLMRWGTGRSQCDPMPTEVSSPKLGTGGGVKSALLPFLLFFWGPWLLQFPLSSTHSCGPAPNPHIQLQMKQAATAMSALRSQLCHLFSKSYTKSSSLATRMPCPTHCGWQTGRIKLTTPEILLSHLQRIFINHRNSGFSDLHTPGNNMSPAWATPRAYPDILGGGSGWHPQGGLCGL